MTRDEMRIMGMGLLLSLPLGPVCSKLDAECEDTKSISIQCIHATETEGINSKIELNWCEGKDAVLIYTRPGRDSPMREIYAKNPLGEGIYKACKDSKCISAGQPGSDVYLAAAKATWDELCEEADCKGLYDEWTRTRGW